MRKGYKQFTRIILILLLIGVAITVLNTRSNNNEIVETRTINQYSNMFFDYTIIRYPAKAEVLTPSKFGENLTIGVSADTDELNFGRVESGSDVRKYLNLSTRDGKWSRIIVNAKGAIAPLIAFNKNDFLFNGNELISVNMNAGSYPGNYTGEVAVVIQRSKYDLLSSILGY